MPQVPSNTSNERNPAINPLQMAFGMLQGLVWISLRDIPLILTVLIKQSHNSSTFVLNPHVHVNEESMWKMACHGPSMDELPPC